MIPSGGLKGSNVFRFLHRRAADIADEARYKHLQIDKTIRKITQKAPDFPFSLENQGLLCLSSSLGYPKDIKKETAFRLSLLVREAGLEPARP